MNVQNMAQLVTSFPQDNSVQQNQQNQLLQGMPQEALTGAPLSGTDFGAASVYNPGEQAPTPETFTPDMARVGQMWNRHQEQVNAFRQMVETLLGQQAQRQGLADSATLPPNFNLGDIEVTEEMQSEAQAMISEGGYFSVEATASRILDFAVALTGGDPARVEMMRNAVDRGFEMASRSFGGDLPEISQQTRAAVMEGFDQWAEAGSAAAITLLQID